MPGALALEGLWPCSMFMSPGKHWLPDPRSHEEEHAGAIPDLLWPSPGKSTQPHGKRLLSQVLEVQNVLRFAFPKPEEAQLDLRWGLLEITGFPLPLLPRPCSNVKCHRCSKVVAFGVGDWGWGGNEGPCQSVIPAARARTVFNLPMSVFWLVVALPLSPFSGQARNLPSIMPWVVSPEKADLLCWVNL
jgi:hypothetical protein